MALRVLVRFVDETSNPFGNAAVVTGGLLRLARVVDRLTNGWVRRTFAISRQETALYLQLRRFVADCRRNPSLRERQADDPINGVWFQRVTSRGLRGSPALRFDVVFSELILALLLLVAGFASVLVLILAMFFGVAVEFWWLLASMAVLVAAAVVLGRAIWTLEMRGPAEA